MKADAASLGVSSYAQAAGAIEVADLKVSVYSSGSLRGAFAGRRCEATVGSYGKLALTGSAVVEDVTVQLSSQGEFSAPDLRVKRYDIRASSYSKAEVWCSELLKIEASSSARVLYDGPGRLETLSDNIRRR